MQKETLIDVIVNIVLIIVIVIEIMVGFKMLENKWAHDTSSVIDKSILHGKQVGVIETVFSWPEVTGPDAKGDIVEIDENRFQINGTATPNATKAGYVYYSSATDSNASHYVQYKEVIDKNSVDGFHKSLTSYFEGNAEGLVSLLGINTQAENVTAYQQTFTDGAIPVLYDEGSEQYFMYLDCGTTYYLLQCDEPFIVSDAKVTMHYNSAGDDPMTAHAWSTYEAGAIDNTRQKMMSKDDQLSSYTNPSELEVGQANSGTTSVDMSGNEYTNQSDTSTATELYMTPEDEAAREIILSYGTKKFLADGSAEDGSTNIDISSTSALASQWVLTETQYTYTDYGITLNGLSGRRTSTLFEINGVASNTISSTRPWVLCVKFMGEDNTLLGVKVIDNRNNPIPADGTSDFSVQLGASDEIDFAKIVAIQFAMR